MAREIKRSKTKSENLIKRTWYETKKGTIISNAEQKYIVSAIIKTLEHFDTEDFLYGSKHCQIFDKVYLSVKYDTKTVKNKEIKKEVRKTRIRMAHDMGLGENTLLVVTQNSYDKFGNITKTEIIAPNGEKISETYGYNVGGSHVTEDIREQPSSVSKNGVEVMLAYNEPWQTPNFSISGDCAEEWKYDKYHERLTEKKYSEFESTSEQTFLETSLDKRRGELLAKNNLAYDMKGNIKSVTDQSGRKYGFEYNGFGEPVEYYEYEEDNRNLLLNAFGIWWWRCGIFFCGCDFSKGIEMYDTRRFICMTGDVINASGEIKDYSDRIGQIVYEFLGRRPPKREYTAAPATQSDTELIKKISDSRQGIKFNNLYKGDTSGYPSHSHADSALVFMLAWWTQNPLQIDSIFVYRV